MESWLTRASSFSRPDAYPTSVATQVSSSNHLPGENVFVETDVPIVWTVEVRGEGEEL